MIEFREPDHTDKDQLWQLWQRVFHEDADFLSSFFSRAYSPRRCRVAMDWRSILAMLYWFDCEWQGQKIAYLYGVGTDPAHRGRGLASGLLEDTHKHLKQLGYAGAILVPSTPELFGFYEKLGYRTTGYLSESTVRAGTPIALREVDPAEYGRLRRQLLPDNGVIQEKENLPLLNSLARLYAGENFIAAVSRGPEGNCIELLGNPDAAPGILAKLDIPEALVRTPGKQKPFAMTCWFSDQNPPETLYFGLAFD